jgi:hypothetical protein
MILGFCSGPGCALLLMRGGHNFGYYSGDVKVMRRRDPKAQQVTESYLPYQRAIPPHDELRTSVHAGPARPAGVCSDHPSEPFRRSGDRKTASGPRGTQASGGTGRVRSRRMSARVTLTPVAWLDHQAAGRPRVADELDDGLRRAQRPAASSR